MSLLGKITGKVAKQVSKPQLTPDAKDLQNIVKTAYKESLENVMQGVPDTVKSQQDAMKGLAALSEQIKATLPK